MFSLPVWKMLSLSTVALVIGPTTTVSEPYITLNTSSVWFSASGIDIVWSFRDAGTCSKPLETTLDLIDCQDGTVVNSTSTYSTSFTIPSTDFISPNNYYSLSASSNTSEACGQLPYLFRLHPTVNIVTESYSVTEGSDLCLNISEFQESLLVAFWPTRIRSENCYCPVVFTLFARCYCLLQNLTDFEVDFTLANTVPVLCWRKLNQDMNGTRIGLVKDERIACGGGYRQAARSFLKSIIIFIHGMTVSASNISQYLPSTLQPTRAQNSHSVGTVSDMQMLCTSPAPYLNENINNSTYSITIVVAAGASLLLLPLGLLAILIPTLLWICRRLRRNKQQASNDHVYDSPQLSTIEPVYEDIIMATNQNTLPSIAMELNEAYASRRTKRNQTEMCIL